MSSTLTEKVKSRYSKIAPYLPALAFFIGFLWDAITLGLKIKTSDLYIVMGYYFCASFCLVLMGRNPTFKFSKYLPLLFQFFLGGVFSALVIFYFKSSAQIYSYLTVALIAVLLVLNEFISSHYTRQTISWLMLSICGTMFFNFFIPHIMGSLLALWFYLSIVISVAIIYGLRKYVKLPRGNSWPAYTAQAVILCLFILNWIPPVPLVQKNMVICHDLKKEQGHYFAKKEKAPWYDFLSPKSQVLHHKPTAGIYCFSSVFAPDGIQSTIYHRWEYYSESQKKWQARDRIGFSIRSGRESGYRGYSFKKNLETGWWRIKVETDNGRIIGQRKFYIQETMVNQELNLLPILLE